jgi:hypothetical protein
MLSLKAYARTAMMGAALATATFAVATTATTGPVRAEVSNVSLPTIPFKLKNKSKLKKDLYVYIVGMTGSTWVHVTNASGAYEAFTEQTTPVPFGFNVGKDKKVNLVLPQLQAMRIYFSFGKPLMLTVSPANVPGVPAGWSSGDPNYKTIFDWTEFTWVPDGANSTLGGNATQVDMFGFATQIRLAGVEGDFTTPVVKKSGFRKANSRLKIFEDLYAAKRPWKKLIVGKKKKPLRVIAPYHGMISGVFPANQLQKYINKVWSKYETKTMTAAPQNVPYTGKVVNGLLVFTQDGNPSVSFSFPKPTSQQAYEGAILPDPIPSDTLVEQQARAIGALLQGAFMRTTLAKNGDLDACKRKQFYKNKPVNEYAKAIHKPAIKKLAYAFGFDDTCSQSSYIGVHNPTSILIKILPLKDKKKGKNS